MQQASLGRKLREFSWRYPLFIAVSLLLLGWLLHTPGGLLGKADAIGYAVCHRINLRSFHLGERTLPLCARCTGMYLGAMLALVYQGLLGPRRSGYPPPRVLIVLAFLLLAFVADGLNSFFSFFPGAPLLYPPQNWMRLLSGTAMGIVMMAALYPAFNQTAWKTQDTRPALEGMRQFLGLLLLGGALAGMILTQNPLLLYPLALISAAGVLVMLSMVYSMICMFVFKRENIASHAAQLIIPLIGGFGLALAQIALLDFIRFLLTGTWNGFSLG